MAKRVKKIQANIYRVEYAEDEGVSDAEYDTFPAATDEEARAAAQQMTNRAQVALQLFQRIEGMNFHIARLEPVLDEVSDEAFGEMTEEENEAFQLAGIEEDAEFHSARTPVCGSEWGCFRCQRDEDDLGL